MSQARDFPGRTKRQIFTDGSEIRIAAGNPARAWMPAPCMNPHTTYGALPEIMGRRWTPVPSRWSENP